MPLFIVRVWNALWLLSDKCQPRGMNDTPAGLLYTPSMAITPSRAKLRLNATLVLVFVSIPPANDVPEIAMENATANNLILHIFKILWF